MEVQSSICSAHHLTFASKLGDKRGVEGSGCRVILDSRFISNSTICSGGLLTRNVLMFS